MRCQSSCPKALLNGKNFPMVDELLEWLPREGEPREISTRISVGSLQPHGSLHSPMGSLDGK